MHRGVERVEHVRPVERDREDGSVAAGLDLGHGTTLSQQEPGAELVGVLEDEAMLASAVSAPFDLGDHGWNVTDLRVADDAAGELAADDAEVPQLLPARKLTGRVEQREAGRRAAAARRPVDLPVREDGHVALDVRAFALPEDHAVDVAQLRLDGVDDVVRDFDRGLELAPAGDQARQLAGSTRSSTDA